MNMLNFDRCTLVLNQSTNETMKIKSCAIVLEHCSMMKMTMAAIAVHGVAS